MITAGRANHLFELDSGDESAAERKLLIIDNQGTGQLRCRSLIPNKNSQLKSAPANRLLIDRNSLAQSDAPGSGNPLLRS